MIQRHLTSHNAGSVHQEDTKSSNDIADNGRAQEEGHVIDANTDEKRRNVAFVAASWRPTSGSDDDGKEVVLQTLPKRR